VLILFALVSTVVVVSGTAGVTAELSTFTFVESVDVVESVLELSQAAKTDATANANNTFFIFGVLIINYLPLIPYLKKGNPLIYTNFTPFLGYFSLIIVLIIAL
jgi:hypothetical protein